MSQENLKKPEETYQLEDINNKANEETPLTKPEENGDNNGQQTSGLEEKLALENDTEASQTATKKKSIAAALLAAQDMLQNPKFRLICGIVFAVLLFLFILVVSIVIIANEENDDKTYRFIRIVPRPRGPSNLLYYRHGNTNSHSSTESWMSKVDEIKQFLAPYRRPENVSLCPLSSNKSSDSVCLFDLNAIAKECLQPNYGYLEGRPCIFIVFNNISDWVPEFNNPDSNGTQYSSNIVGIECTPNTQFDAENVGPMEFTPYQGFSPIFFPYRGQSNYMAPFVALRLIAPTHNLGIGITCRILASNVANEDGDSNQPLSHIPFNIFID